jgi:2'-5' RNA ligase
MRVFLAVEVSADVRERVAELARELRPSLPRARFVPKENLHLTLRVLGEATKQRVDRVAATLSRGTGALSGFALDFRGLGVFPCPKRARVLWVGTTDTPNDLLALHSTVERVVREEGFEPERGRFHAHLTVARFREPPRDVGSILEAAEGRVFGSTKVRAFVLFESVTSPSGSSYRALQSFPLASDP